MSRLVSILFLVCVLTGALPGARPAEAALLDAELESVLLRSDETEMVPVMIHLEDEGLPRHLIERLCRLDRHGRRTEGAARLRDRVAFAHADLFAAIDLLEEQGRAGRRQPLYAANAIALTITPSALRDLLVRPGIRTVRWDPPVPVAQMEDRGTMPPGGWSTIQADPGRPDPQVWWQLDAVHAPACWSAGYDGSGVVVAVLDSGVDYTHADLAARIFSNAGEIPDNGIDDDENGFIDDVRGWDFVDNDNDPMGYGQTDHGTLVAGIVAGDGTSGIRTGVAPGATILPIRVVGASWSAIFAGIDYAILMGADVIQMSVSQKWRFTPKPDYASWRAAADLELELGVFHANSIGNEGDNQNTDPVPFNIAAPGNCPSPWSHPDQYVTGGTSGIVAVGAIGETNYADDSSSRGPSAWEDIAAFQPVYPWEMPSEYQDYPWSGGEGGLIKPDLCAPGSGTLSTALGGGYLAFSGTSAATPHVAGAMAILLSADSTLTPAEMDMILQTTAADLGDPGKDNLFGAGRLDCHAALIRTLNRAQFGRIAGTVRDAVTDSLLPGTRVTLSTGAALRTDEDGAYHLPVLGGAVEVVIDRFGYFPDTSSVFVAAGETPTVHDRSLVPRPQGQIAGVVRDTGGPALAGVRVAVREAPSISALSDTAGAFLLAGIPAEVPLTVEVIRFGHHPQLLPVTAEPDSTDTLQIEMEPGVRDDFELDQGWSLEAGGTAVMGRWERGDPAGTWHNGAPVQPEDDATAEGTQCWLTQNANPGAGQELTDVDGGTTALVSPLFDGTVFTFPVLSYRRWYSNNTGGPADDPFLVQVSSDGGGSWTTLETVTLSAPQWVERSWELVGRVAITSTMRIRFRAQDLGSTSIVEAAVDEISVTQSLTASLPGDDEPRTSGPGFALGHPSPSPAEERTSIRFALPRAAAARLTVFDIQGRRVRELAGGIFPAGEHLATWDGRDEEGRRCAGGVYLYRLEQGAERATGRVVLIR